MSYVINGFDGIDGLWDALNTMFPKLNIKQANKLAPVKPAFENYPLDVPIYHVGTFLSGAEEIDTTSEMSGLGALMRNSKGTSREDTSAKGLKTAATGTSRTKERERSKTAKTTERAKSKAEKLLSFSTPTTKATGGRTGTTTNWTGGRAGASAQVPAKKEPAFASRDVNPATLTRTKDGERFGYRPGPKQPVLDTIGRNKPVTKEGLKVAAAVTKEAAKSFTVVKNTYENLLARLLRGQILSGRGAESIPAVKAAVVEAKVNASRAKAANNLVSSAIRAVSAGFNAKAEELVAKADDIIRMRVEVPDFAFGYGVARAGATAAAAYYSQGLGETDWGAIVGKVVDVGAKIGTSAADIYAKVKTADSAAAAASQAGNPFVTQPVQPQQPTQIVVQAPAQQQQPQGMSTTTMAVIGAVGVAAVVGIILATR